MFLHSWCLMSLKSLWLSLVCISCCTHSWIESMSKYNDFLCLAPLLQGLHLSILFQVWEWVSLYLWWSTKVSSGWTWCTSSFCLSSKGSPLLWSLVASWGMFPQQWTNFCCCYLPLGSFPLDTVKCSTLRGWTLILEFKGKYHKKVSWIVVFTKFKILLEYNKVIV